MEEKYLLPCRCGHQVPGSRGQAGETVRCVCGASLEVPTLLRLTTLPQAEQPAPAAPPGESWGLRHRLWLLGTLVFVVALVPIVILALSFPSPPRKINPPPEQIHREFDAYSARETWLWWQHLRRSDVNALFVQDQLGFEEAKLAYEEVAFKYQMGIGVLALFCLVGVGLVVAGSLQRPPGTA